jgi:phosphoglycolate phosphatase
VSEHGKKLIAIDLDGTLVDSAPDIAHCLGAALEAIGYAAPGEARTRAWIGDGLETLIARAIGHGAGGHAAAQPDERHRKALAAFLECYNANLFVRSRLYPAVAETLDALQAQGFKLCCITNKRYAFSQALLLQAGIRERFELLLGGDSLAEKKPSPLQLNVAAETLGVKPSAAILVGDSHQDLRAARAAGFGFVLASYGYGKIDETELGASPRLRTFAELPAALQVAAKRLTIA